MYIKRILLIIVLLGLIAAGFFANFVYKAMFKPNTAFNNDLAYIYVETGSNYNQVRDQLKPLLKDIEAFDALAVRKKYTTNVKPGRYLIKNGMNNNDIINSIRSNNIPVTLTFNNQETLNDLAGRVSQQIEADSLSLLIAFKDQDFLELNRFTEETILGLFIPNSYEFFWNTSAEKFRDRMLIEYNKFWNESRLEKAKALKLSIDEVTSLASIVQKETAKVEERPRVAGVYLNRLNRNMPLQADPTVIFAIKKKRNDFDTVIKRVLYKDLEIDSPYNTYKNGGIPPGPITMPDISSIDAVLNPEKHNYLYFVADINRMGYHKFAKTLSQHNRNKAEYVKWINQQGINR